MARGEDKGGSSKGRVKFRFIEFEMDGSDQTLQNTIREITQAMGRPGTVVVRSSPAAAALPAGKANGEQLEAADVIDAEPALPDDQEDAGEVSAKRPRQSRRFKSPGIVDTDLRSGDMPLRTFMEKAPETVDERYTLIAYWFKQFHQINEITAAHINTAYIEMDWTNLPKDVGQPLRKLKVDNWFDKGEGEGAYTLNHIGYGKARDMIKESGMPA